MEVLNMSANNKRHKKLNRPRAKKSVMQGRMNRAQNDMYLSIIWFMQMVAHLGVWLADARRFSGHNEINVKLNFIVATWHVIKKIHFSFS